MENGRIGEVLGALRLEELIGCGGMGEVYRARRIDGVVSQQLAVKVLRALHRHGVPDEADTLRPLNHPNIAKCFDSGLTSDGHRYLVLEYVGDQPITDYSDQKGLSIHERLEMFLSVCSAIEYLHHHLTVHLDLKPGNILVNRDGVVKVIDFGVARHLEDRPIAAPPVAFSGPSASPEQIQTGARLGFPTDIYALGAVLYELLCGHEPFDPCLAVGELERQILEEIPELPSNALNHPKLKRSDTGKHFRLEPDALARMRGCRRTSEGRKLVAGDLDRICLFALRKDGWRRYRSVDDLTSDVASVLEGRKPRIARSGDPMYTALRAARRNPIALMGAVALVATVLNGLSLFGLFSNARAGSLEHRRQLDKVSDASLKELRKELRPLLASDPRLRDSLEALDDVLRAAAPVQATKTLVEMVVDGFDLQIRRITGTIPRGDLPDLP